MSGTQVPSLTLPNPNQNQMGQGQDLNYTSVQTQTFMDIQDALRFGGNYRSAQRLADMAANEALQIAQIISGVEQQKNTNHAAEVEAAYRRGVADTLQANEAAKDSKPVDLSPIDISQHDTFADPNQPQPNGQAA